MSIIRKRGNRIDQSYPKTVTIFLYWREFSTPDNKPYLFLGRHRVLIKPRTRLYSYIKQLTNDKRYAQTAKTIHLLQEDEAGHVPDALRNYL